MGLYRKFVGNTRKPEGLLGRLMVAGMNSGHAALADWGCQSLEEESFSMILDIGCGGGANVKRFLQRCPQAHVTGVDYSAVSVEKAGKLNAAAIQAGRCEILQADVTSLTLSDNTFDLATAFETVYFWPDISRSFGQIFRVLRPGGRFLIVNESTGTDAAAVKYSKIIDGMQLYTPERLKALLEAAGFAEVELRQASDKPWIAVLGRKPQKERMA